MRPVDIRGREVMVPECVSELTPGQYEYYCRLSFAMAAGVMSAEYFRVRWFSYLIGRGKSDFTVLRDDLAAALAAQMPVVDGFLVADGAGGLSLDFNTVVNLLPVCNGHRGPGDLLQGATFGEFIECCTVAGCLDGSDPGDLMECYGHIARILYHIPEGEPVPDILAFHAPRLFSNVWGAIQREPVVVNGRRVDFQIIFRKSGESGPDDGTGWAGIIFEIAAAGLFGDVEAVRRADMWEVLMYLYKCKFEYLHEKKQK